MSDPQASNPQPPDAAPTNQQPPAYQPPPAYQQTPAYPSMPYPAAPGYQPGGVLMEHPNATMILILGILGIVISAGILSPIALVMGNKAKKECAEGKYALTSSLTIGWVLGLIGTILLAIGVVVMIIMIIVFIIAMSTAATMR